ncbi:MAG TPA: protein translocase subunit SecD [Bacteroidetes bacterium]|nr:protein translocase subunit SecD [Bacteroidota bacterium]
MRKVLGKIILVAVTIIAAIAMLFPTFRAYQLEKVQAQYVDRAKKAKTPADSLAIMESFKKEYGESLTSAKKSQLKLGLDLRGGMYVTLEVDVLKLIEENATKEAIDETFEQVITKTRQQVGNSDQDIIDAFLENFDAIARPKGKSLISYFDFGNIRDLTEEKIIDKLRADQNNAIDQALEVMRTRIDQYGVSEPNIQKQGANRIVLELPGVSNTTEMRSLLQTTARLEFKLVKNNKQIVEFFYRVDNFLKSYGASENLSDSASALQTIAKATSDTTKPEPAANILADSLKRATDTSKIATDSTQKSDTSDPYAGLPQEEATRRYIADHPFTRLFATYYSDPQQRNAQAVPVYYTNDNFPEGEYTFRILEDSIAKFQEILNRPEIKSMMPSELEIAYDAKPELSRDEKIKIYGFYSLKKEPELTGDVITDALATYDPTNNAPMVTMAMNSEGADRWGKITGANLQKRISIVLDGRVYSAPVVQSKITGGSSQITGMANTEEAHLLEIVLKAGALKAPVEIIEERIVGPSLGEDSIKYGVTASIFAALVVIMFMLLYYTEAGLVADIAVILNITLILGVLASLGGTLSLPGLAGIILTLGMAVDANVLIYERTREELAKGRSLKSAIDEGFSKALSAILDSNVTTFITGLILYFLGSGPIKGFALTLMIGIIGTLFTAILISRALIEISMQAGWKNFSFGQKKSISNI